MLEDFFKIKCILLVDDIFSELDETRRKNMIDLLKKGNQVFFTMVNSTLADKNEFENISVFTVHNNVVEQNT